MAGRTGARATALAAWGLALAAGCATAGDPPAPASGEPALAGTSWRLVEIVSMDDSVYAPADRALYTVTFGADGTVAIRADCNRGTGTWTSPAGGPGLAFGVIAATQAACAPGSLHDRFMSQFEWVRSYVIENGHLFLATMADGSIIEFEPAPPN